MDLNASSHRFASIANKKSSDEQTRGKPGDADILAAKDR